MSCCLFWPHTNKWMAQNMLRPIIILVPNLLKQSMYLTWKFLHQSPSLAFEACAACRRVKRQIQGRSPQSHRRTAEPSPQTRHPLCEIRFKCDHTIWVMKGRNQTLQKRRCINQEQPHSQGWQWITTGANPFQNSIHAKMSYYRREWIT